jgi:hypothetical protein
MRDDVLSAHELARLLQAGPDLPVHIMYDYGDRSHRLAAPAVTEVEEAKVKHSAYIENDVLDEEAEEDSQEVIIVSNINPHGF